MAVVICLDAGHGGHDSGATRWGLQEKERVLKLVLKVGKYLSEGYEGVKVIYTRTNDTYKSLSYRADYANSKGADYFYSFHINSAADDDAHGYESFVYTSVKKETLNVQSKIHNKVVSYLKKYGITDRGKKKANFFVLRFTKMPAVLFENLFISNRRENNLLRDESFLNGLAKAYADAIANCHDLKPKAKKPAPSPSPVEKPGYVWAVQAGAYSDEKGAKEQVEKLKKAGFSAYYYKKEL